MIKAIITLIIIAALSLSYIQLGEQFDDQLNISNAYISGRVIKVKSGIEGLIKNIYFNKGQQVKRGDLLFDFDSQAIDIQINYLTQQLRQAIDNQLKLCLDSQVAVREIALSQANLDYLKGRKQRLTQLAKNKSLAKEDIINIERDINNETLNLAILNARLSSYSLGQQLPLIDRPEINMSINRLQDAAYQQHLYQQYAASDGYVYDVLTYPGQRVDQDTTLMIFLPKNTLFVEANVLESNLHHLKKGKAVAVMLDTAVNDPPLKGFVHSIVPATASSFSILPRNNTDSNWIKVAQRVPVLIEVPDSGDGISPIGSSVEVIVDIKSDEQYQQHQAEGKTPTANKVKAPVDWKLNFDQKLKTIMQTELAKIDMQQYQHCQIALP